MNRPVLPSLTGLRFLAAWLVVSCHYVLLDLPGTKATVPAWIRNIASGGYVAVGLFFILSGFILVYTYIDNDDNKTMRVGPVDFWIARIARIYPVYIFTLLLAMPLFAISEFKVNPPALATIKIVAKSVPSITLAQAWLPWVSDAINPPAWSLSAEASYYLLFPFILPLVARAVKKQRWLVLAGLYIAALIAPILYVVGLSSHPIVGMVLTRNPIFRLPEFLIGVALGCVFVDKRSGAVRDHANKVSFWPVASIAALFGIGLVLYFSSEISLYLLYNGLLDPLFVVLIYGSAASRGPLTWVLSRPLFVLLGEASYSLYLLHLVIWSWITALTSKVTNVAPIIIEQSLVVVVFYALFVVLLSVILYRYLESPARLWIRRGLSEKILSRWYSVVFGNRNHAI